MSLKRDLNAIEIGYFCDFIPLSTRNENGILLLMEQKDMINRE
jgi:hypothetical protein